MIGWSEILRRFAALPHLSPAERAAADRAHAAACDTEVAVLRMSIALHDTAGSLRNFMEACIASDARLSLDEAEEVATHPDLAELNVMMDGYYTAPSP